MASALANDPDRSPTPLESFLRHYVETIGGDWDEVESQVYDVLIPAANDGTLFETASGVLRLTFDPEALPEHPGAQLASFGTPLVDAFVSDAQRRGRVGRFYLVGLNLAPHDLAGRVLRALKLAPPLTLQLDRIRALLFPQMVFWFQAEFSSDQKEHAILPVAIDAHYLREVRHLDKLLEPARLSERPSQPLPEARRAGLADVYLAAREQVVRSVAALASTRDRELRERGERQVARMRRYYADLRQELESPRRGRQTAEADERLAARRQAIDREEQVRIAELRQKNQLRVRLRLGQSLHIQQPKLLLTTRIADTKRTAPLELVWDPLTDSVEAAACPACGRPGYSFRLDGPGKVTCEGCNHG
ncbi:MAG: hypothetical protein AB7K24_16920 [Gemmataceae bacterium]